MSHVNLEKEHCGQRKQEWKGEKVPGVTKAPPRGRAPSMWQNKIKLLDEVGQ